MRPPLPISNADRARHAGDLIQQGQIKAAERLLKEVLRDDPNQVDALIAFGVLSGMRGQLGEAVKHLRRAVQRSPGTGAAQFNLGQALIRLGRFADALEPLERALAIAETPLVREKLGDCLRQLGRLDEAAVHYRRAVALAPGNSLALSSAVETLRKVCDWTGLDALEQALIDAARRGEPVEPLLLQHVIDDPKLQLQAAAAYWRALVAPTAPPPVRLSSPRPRDRIRVGYLSADFRNHPMVSVIAEAIELHDRRRFDVIGYSYGHDDGSPQRKRMQQAFGRFVDIEGMSEVRAAERIAGDGLDILVDLAGYTANARLGIVAARPAPVIAHYMGFPGSLGSPAYDYVIADGVVAPAGCESDYSEALVRLPRCYWAVDRKRQWAEPRPMRRDHGLPDDAVVLCSFNGQQKLSPRLMDVWARVLAAVPGAVLWLYSDTAAAVPRLKQEAAARGIAEARVMIAGRVPGPEHLARIPLADLMLDTQPYGGHTTACDALFMGVPVLSVAGRSFTSRVGASLLTAAGLPELVMPSLEAWEREVIALASDRARLAALRARTEVGRGSSALFDTAGFVRGLEAAYAEMSARARRGERPAGIDAA